MRKTTSASAIASARGGRLGEPLGIRSVRRRADNPGQPPAGIVSEQAGRSEPVRAATRIPRGANNISRGTPKCGAVTNGEEGDRRQGGGASVGAGRPTGQLRQDQLGIVARSCCVIGLAGW